MAVNKELEDLQKKLTAANKLASDLESEKNSCKVEARTLKEQRDSLRTELDEHKALLFESREELKLSEKAEQEKEFLVKENQKLHTQLIINLERLRKSEEKAAYLLSEKRNVWNSFNEQAELLKESALNDLKAMKAMNEELSRENAALRAYNDELYESVKNKEQKLAEHRQQLEDTKQSYKTREKASADLISALQKINEKLRQKLQQSNGVCPDC